MSSPNHFACSYASEWQPTSQAERRRNDGALLVVESDPLREPQRDHALTQNMLHRLPETEVDAERERSDEAARRRTVMVCRDSRCLTRGPYAPHR